MTRGNSCSSVSSLVADGVPTSRAFHPVPSRSIGFFNGRVVPFQPFLMGAAMGTVSLRRIGRLFAPYRAALALMLVVIVATSAVELAAPFLLRTVIDTALPHRDLDLLLHLAGGLV